MKVGAQRCVIQRVRKSAGSATSRGLKSVSLKNSRVWSSAMSAITRPRRRSTDESLGRTWASVVACLSMRGSPPSGDPVRRNFLAQDASMGLIRAPNESQALLGGRAWNIS